MTDFIADRIELLQELAAISRVLDDIQSRVGITADIEELRQRQQVTMRIVIAQLYGATIAGAAPAAIVH